ncbi:MAG TPA: hypothetical protein VNE16_08435 [Vicinamibacterales bacterium]|nr:hypothetical protein [Vicinamibacterales bacterium]
MDVEILLVSAEWKLRIAVRAQLIEEGFEVEAHEVWEFVELLLRSGARHPRLIIIDVAEEHHPSALLRTLARLAAPAHVLVLTAPSVQSADEVRALGFPHVLARPFSVREVVATAAHLLAAAPGV